MADTTFGLSLETVALRGDNTPREEDAALVCGLRNGEDWAYEALIGRFQQPVYSLVYRLMDDPGDSADVVQEVFLKVFRKIGSFRGESSLKTWMYRIAVNEAHNHRRWFSRHRRKQIGLGAEEDGTSYQDVLPDPGRSPFDLALDQETRAAIEAELGRMNPNFRAVVVLRDLEDLEYEEIASVLDISLGTVKSRLVRGREALRKQLEMRFNPVAGMQWTPQPAE